MGSTMKAVVLCGGEGTRLRPFTHTQAKHLLPVAGKPVVEHALAAVREAGIRDVAIVVSPSVEGQFQERLGDGSRVGLRLTYVVQPEARGLAHAVLCAQSYLGNGPFLVYLGDNLLQGGITGVVSLFRSQSPAAVVTLRRVEDPRRFGVAVIEDGRLVRLVEKPEHPPSDLAIVGAYAFTPLLFQAAREVKPSFRGELELTDCLQWLVDRGHPVLPFEVRGWWQDVGRPADLLAANRLLLAGIEPRVEGEVDGNSSLEGLVVIERGARVVASRVIGPAVVGEEAVIERSTVGPHVAVGPRAVVREATVADTILMDGARVEQGARIVGAVLGRGARVRLPMGRPSSAFLGDESTLEVKEEG
ncbi:MAG: Glucose-1-phosphate thymidylyltransferase [Candidatus Bipolaricaulis sibiricus]|uniref:Glucose-1-phosphate thymidylyltransferase n=1 Tax=Bipolaricaulis sibiricus TaxID=2501609 RepID=A0A410FTF0_BIPS1|nr:MAG: Glucose-1-phosphate thymidylyltransferase [Candidatus Bipolaricaulis sibiricus]